MRAELQIENEKLQNKLKQSQAENKKLLEDKIKAENELKSYREKADETIVNLRSKVGKLKEVLADIQHAQEKKALSLTR